MTPTSHTSARIANFGHNAADESSKPAFKLEWHKFSQAVVDGALRPETRLSVEEVQDLADWLASSPAELHTLNLNGRLPAGGMVVLLEVLKVNTTLHSLDLSSNPMHASDAEALSEMLKVNRSLCALSLRACRIDTDMIKQLSDALKHNVKLETLNLRDNIFDDDALIALSDALAVNTALVSLDINQSLPGESDPCFRDFGMSALVEAFKRNQTLVQISLGCVETSMGTRAKLLSALRDNRSIQKLNFFDVNFSEQDRQLIRALLAENATLAGKRGLQPDAWIGLLMMADGRCPDEVMDLVFKALIKMPSIPKNDVVTTLHSLARLGGAPAAGAAGMPAQGGTPGKSERI